MQTSSVISELSPPDASGLDSFGGSSESPPEAKAQKNHRASVAIFTLYALFFILWCLGLFIGFMDDMPQVFGMPAWFAVSCVGAYAVTCFALVRVVRRHF